MENPREYMSIENLTIANYQLQISLVILLVDKGIITLEDIKGLLGSGQGDIHKINQDTWEGINRILDARSGDKSENPDKTTS